MLRTALSTATRSRGKSVAEQISCEVLYLGHERRLSNRRGAV
jgi:hypothetical protein